MSRLRDRYGIGQIAIVHARRVGINTIPTAREEAGRDSIRGESRPAFIIEALLHCHPRQLKAFSLAPERGASENAFNCRGWQWRRASIIKAGRDSPLIESRPASSLAVGIVLMPTLRACTMAI